MINVLGISIDPANPEASIVAAIDAKIESEIKSKFPAASATFPHLNQAIEGAVAFAQDLMNVYALKKLESLTGSVLDSLAKKYPMAATEVAALKAKLPNL